MVHVPLGELETFWEAKEETGAEYSVLKGTEYMRRKRKQDGGPAREGAAGEDTATGTPKRTKGTRAEAVPSQVKRKPHGGAGAGGGR